MQLPVSFFPHLIGYSFICPLMAHLFMTKVFFCISLLEHGWVELYIVAALGKMLRTVAATVHLVWLVTEIEYEVKD